MEDSRQPAHVVKCAVVLQQCAPGIFCSGLYVSYAFCITSGDPIASSRSLDTHSFEARLGDLPTSLSLCGESSVSSSWSSSTIHICASLKADDSNSFPGFFDSKEQACDVSSALIWDFSFGNKL